MFAFAKTDIRAILPERQNNTDAGYDLTALENDIIQPRSRGCIDTGVAISIPNDCYARVAPRSGLAFKYGIDVLAGVIDCGYTNSIKVILMNNSDEEFVVKSGDRIAQLIFEKIYTPDNIKEIEYDELKSRQSNNTRGLNGFGSTGINKS